MIDTILKAVAVGAGLLANLAQNKLNERNAAKLDKPIGQLMIERAREDMERRRKEARGKQD